MQWNSEWLDTHIPKREIHRERDKTSDWQKMKSQADMVESCRRFPLATGASRPWETHWSSPGNDCGAAEMHYLWCHTKSRNKYFLRITVKYGNVTLPLCSRRSGMCRHPKISHELHHSLQQSNHCFSQFLFTFIDQSDNRENDYESSSVAWLCCQ